MSFEKRLFKLVPAYLKRQQYIAESNYDLDWNHAHAPPGSEDYLGDTWEELGKGGTGLTPKQIEAYLMESWHDANICTNEAQNPERWFDYQIFLVMDGWNRGPSTMLKAVTYFMTTVCRIMESVDSNLGKSNMKEIWHAENVRNNYIAENLDTYPRPNTNDELFMTVADILRKCH
jgi:hypothetical protein